jgi:enamine deaminase RidA (YjgF/YER057c/UK114 family)
MEVTVADELKGSKFILEPTWEAQYGYSPAVTLQGGRHLILAGHIGYFGDDHSPIEGDFARQFEQTFRNIERTLERLGASRTDIVSMMVHLIDPAHIELFTEMRRSYFGKDFPASTLVVISSFAIPGPLVEVTPTAWLPD